MKALGFRDILTIPALAGLREIDLLSPHMDKAVFPYLYEMGIDTEYGVEIVVANYRDMNNKVGIGYRYVGDIRCGRDFIKSPWCDIIDRVTASAYQDPSLTKELCSLMSKPVSRIEGESWSEDDTDDFPASQCEPDYLDSAKLIWQLENILFSVRGSQRNECGSIKLSKEYIDN